MYKKKKENNLKNQNNLKQNQSFCRVSVFSNNIEPNNLKF